jgi:hypothetical protein
LNYQWRLLAPPCAGAEAMAQAPIALAPHPAGVVALAMRNSITLLAAGLKIFGDDTSCHVLSIVYYLFFAFNIPFVEFSVSFVEMDFRNHFMRTIFVSANDTAISEKPSKSEEKPIQEKPKRSRSEKPKFQIQKNQKIQIRKNVKGSQGYIEDTIHPHETESGTLTRN